MTLTRILATAATAALLAAPASAQMFGESYGTDIDQNTFQTGLTDAGTYDAWDMDDDAGLNEGEFASGMYADWDMDNDLQITEQEWETGTERWFGSDFDGEFSEWDADGSGYIDQAEFGQNWNADYYAQWDANQNQIIEEDEFTTGLYESADLNEDQVITIEEEGWFEGWFDGDDVEAEIQEVGDVLGS